MKHDTCNKLADHIIERSNYYQHTAKTFALMYADTDSKEYKQKYESARSTEKELRELHITICQYLHKIEEELM